MSLSNGIIRKSPSDLRKKADVARSKKNWWLDANIRHEICLRSGAPAGDWIQYGHSLKELGYFNAAERAYDTAVKISQANAETHLQLGHLLKLMGRYSEAKASMNQAVSLGYADKGHVDFELKLIEDATQQPVPPNAFEDASSFKIFLSTNSAIQSEDSAQALTGLGGADYSYAFAMKGFVDSLDDLDVDYEIITHPEFVANINERSSAQLNIHLAFYPPERLRLLKGAINIACFAWEFERLRSASETASYHAFADQTTMLKIPDYVWVPSKEAKEIISSQVDTDVHYVPSPVKIDERLKDRVSRPSLKELDKNALKLSSIEWQPLAVLPRIQGTMNGMAYGRRTTARMLLRRRTPAVAPTIFLTVLNVHDFRKQLRPMLEGFLQYALEDDNAYLLIKMTTPDRGKLTINEFLAMDQISDPAMLTPPMVSDRVWITDQRLTRLEMNALYDMSSFYVCTSHAEGQNLPILEAMARGVVPISVDITAMSDYISVDNAHVISSRMIEASTRISDRYKMYGLKIHKTEPSDVTQALVHAGRSSNSDYRDRSAAAKKTVREHFSSYQLLSSINSILENHKMATSEHQQ